MSTQAETLAEPTALDVVAKTLRNLKNIGSPAQQRDAELIEQRLGLGQRRAVNFVRRARRDASTGVKK